MAANKRDFLSTQGAFNLEEKQTSTIITQLFH